MAKRQTTGDRPFGLLAMVGLSIGLNLLVGCAEGPVKADPAIAEGLRAALQLAAEPDGAVTPLDWREQAEAPAAPEAVSLQENPSSAGADDEPAGVVLVGTVGGMPNPWPEAEPGFPWREGQATFFLVDPATAAGFADHADEAGDDHAADCPFCAREAASKANAVAAVSFVGEDGKPIGVDVRELFGVAEGDTVVVRGEASLMGGELLVVEADGLFRR